MSKRTAPEVNAGSMADIAFLLLIFFLVTTTIEKDSGLVRQLPREDIDRTIELHERNVLEIKIGEDGDLLVENEILPISDLKNAAINFIDNGGSTKEQEDFCSYCSGKKDPLSSDNPQKAVISISSHRNAPYEKYIEVQNELSAAYNSLRNRESQKLFKYDYTSKKHALDEGYILKNENQIKSQLKQIRDLFPMLISEAEIKAVYH